MVYLMNKKELITTLSQELNYEENKCKIICDILENINFFNKKNKEKIIEELINKLNINNIEANKIYNISLTIIKKEIKMRIINPFK